MKFALALIVTLLAAFPALASPGCMTHSEAKHAYGRDTYLHWTGNHCWGVRHESSRRTDRRSVAKKSAPDVTAFHDSSERGSSSNARAAAAHVGADAVWPDPPTDFTWADRWPNQDRISPDRWLLELVQFGNGINR
jgi:hypothetical protein